MHRRVAITGLGTVSSLGQNVEETWKTVSSGRGGIGQVASLPADKIKLRHGAEAKDFDPTQHLSSEELSMLWRASRMTVVSAREAIRQAQLVPGTYAPLKGAVLLGSPSSLGIDEDDFFQRFYGEGKRRVDPATLVRNMRSAPAHLISHACQLHGPGFVVDSACSGALQAIGESYNMIRSGRFDCVVTGGGDSSFGLSHWKSWEQVGAMSGDTCRPFSLERSGTVLGEGAAIFVLEPLDRALQRGANVLAEIVGYAASRDATPLSEITQPSGERIAQTMTAALEDGSIRPEQIDYINAHGSGTKLNDTVETEAIKRVFGSHAKQLAVSSTKGAHGHLESAAGSIELAITVMAIQNHVLPPTINFLSPDPACDLDYVPNQARPRKIDYAMKNSFGFGGANATIILRAYEI